MLDWLYEPRLRESMVAMNGMRSLRNLTLDVETLADLADEIKSHVNLYYGADPLYPINVTYAIRRGELSREQAEQLHATDKRQLVTTYEWETLPDQHGQQQKFSLVLISEDARIATGVDRPEQLIAHVADFLYRVGEQKPNWLGIRWMLALIPALLILAAYIWFAATAPTVGAIAFGATVVLAAWVGTIIWARRLFLARPRRTTISYRGESRAQTNQRRADERKNLKVALITAPISIVAGVLIALIPIAIIGSGDTEPGQAPAPTPTTMTR